jgi:7-carboxy-7-deazaguanine synthase
MLKINEIFYSIQGESSYSGLPCVFIRLTYCNLRCSYCDSEYSFHEGNNMTIKEIITKVKSYNCPLVEVTGGEPLLQKEAITLMQELLKNKYQVMLETGGSLPIDKVPKEVIKIVDFKCPSSNMSKKNDWTIISKLNNIDEIKFVIGNR